MIGEWGATDLAEDQLFLWVIGHTELYTGRDFDAEVWLQYNRARYYDAKVGRWISEDPIGFAAGDYNLSRYVGNQSVNANDPLGLAKDFVIDGNDPHDVYANDVAAGKASYGSQSWQLRLSQLTGDGTIDALVLAAKLSIGAMIKKGSEFGWKNAVSHLRHFRDNSGTSMSISVTNLLETDRSSRVEFRNYLRKIWKWQSKMEPAWQPKMDDLAVENGATWLC